MQNDTPHPARRGGGHPHPRQGADFHAYHDPNSAARLSTTVAHALADVMGIDVTSTEHSLFERVDVDALDRLFSPHRDGRRRASGHVAFDVSGFQVTVYSSGHIVVTPPGPPR